MAVTLLVTLLVWAGQASAQTPDDSAAVDQYVEDAPTPSGSEAVGQPSKGKSTPLPSATLAKLRSEAGEDAGVLEALATSPAYGAPSEKLEIGRGGDGGSSGAGGSVRGGGSGGPGGSGGAGDSAGSLRPDGDATPAEGLSAAVSAVQGGEAGRLVGVLVALLVITGLAVAGAALRHRGRATFR